jgi:hypothetical protein
MKTCRRGSLLAAAALGLFGGTAHAQVQFAVEGRVGVTFPVGDLSDAGAGSGIGLGGELQANFQTNLSAYLGLYRYQFSCDRCGLGNDPTSTGLGAGLKYVLHNPGDVLAWGRGGIVANKLGSSDRKIGFELGAGADLPIATRIYLVPNVAFVRHSANGDFAASFFTLGLGLHYHFR